MSQLAILCFYNAANATLSDAAHMKQDLTEGEALRHFEKHMEDINEQLRRLRANFENLKKAVEAAKEKAKI